MQKLNNIIKLIVYRFFCLFPIKKNKIVCTNFMKKGFGDNPKYICQELKNKNLDIVWVGMDKEKNTLPNYIRMSSKWYKYLYEFATAKVWISNIRLPKYLSKRKNQFYLQTWHAGLGFKKIEFDAVQGLSKDYIKSAIKDSKMTDLMITDCKFITDVFRKAFRYNGEIIETGLPRNDIFFEPPKINFKKELGLDGFKILLYAPTFRKKNTKDVYNIDFNKVLKKLNKRNEKWKVLVKLHPNIDNSNELIDFSEDVINMTSYSDINDLLFISDLFITDYSSCVFDYMFLGKPALFYTPDIEEYKKERDFYITLESLNIPISENNEQLIENISNVNKLDYKQIYEDIFKKYGVVLDGKASKKIANIILEKISGD